MAPKPITLTFAGDSSSLEKTFEKVGSGAKEMAGDLDKAQSQAKSLDGAMGSVGSTVDSSESKFMGTADVLDGLATTMGLNVGAQIDFARGMGDIAGGLTNLGPMLSGIASKMGLTTAATWLWNTAQTALNLVMSLNPIMLVVLAIGALVAAFVIAYKNSETFRDIVDAAFKAIQRVVGDVIGWILDGIDKFLAGFQAMAQAASHLPLVGDKFKGVADAIGGVRGTVQGLADDMHRVGEESRIATGKLNGAQVAASQIRALGNVSVTVSGPAQPQLRAAGGPVTAGRPYIVGEHRPELFVPNQSGTVIPNVPAGGAAPVTINVSSLDPAGAATAVVRALDEYESRNGPRYARV